MKRLSTQYSYFGARYYDSDLSVWLSVDPMSDDYPNLSPYAYCANNPVILVDPDGKKIRFANSLTNAEKREFKSYIKYLRQNSPTFDYMYRDLKKSKDVYTYDKTTYGNDKYDDKTKTFFICLDGNNLNSIPISMVHETSHGWRDFMGIDIKDSDCPYSINTVEYDVFIKKVIFRKSLRQHISRIL